MRKKTIIKLTILAVVIAVIAAIAWWQFGNIKAIYYGIKYSSEDIDYKMKHSQDTVKEYLESNPQFSVRPTEPVEEELHQESEEKAVSTVVEEQQMAFHIRKTRAVLVINNHECVI